MGLLVYRRQDHRSTVAVGLQDRSKVPDGERRFDAGPGHRGGEVLASLAPFPRSTCATEGYAPNVRLARERPGGLGVEVHDTTADPDNLRLLFPESTFDLVINRHESYVESDILRVLKPQSCFFTQQCGPERWGWFREGYEEECGKKADGDLLSLVRVAAGFSGWIHFTWYWTGPVEEREEGAGGWPVRDIKKITETMAKWGRL